MQTTRSYEERLSAPRLWWALAGVTGLAVALVLLPFGVLPLLGGLIGGTAVVAAGVSAYGSARIRVIAGQLVTSDARIPLTALGAVEVLDEEGARAWRTHKADSRAYMLLRAYIRTAVRVEVTDPDDPTPYLYLSTRDPEGLAAALRADST